MIQSIEGDYVSITNLDNAQPNCVSGIRVYIMTFGVGTPFAEFTGDQWQELVRLLEIFSQANTY